MASGPSTPARTERILLLGWNRRAPLIIDQLRRRARPGSVVDVVADRGEATVRQVREVDAHSGTGLGLTLHHGDVTRPDTLRRLDVHSYDSVIVLGRDPLPGQPPDDPDNRTPVTLLLLRQLEEATGRELPVVTELIDDRNRALAPISPGADVIISGKLIGLLLAQISQSRHLAAVFEELFSAEGSGVRLRPAPDYVLPGSETTFATVVAADVSAANAPSVTGATTTRPRVPATACGSIRPKASGAAGRSRTRRSSSAGTDGRPRRSGVREPTGCLVPSVAGAGGRSVDRPPDGTARRWPVPHAAAWAASSISRATSPGRETARRRELSPVRPVFRDVGST